VDTGWRQENASKQESGPVLIRNRKGSGTHELAGRPGFWYAGRMNLPGEVVEMLGQTVAKVVPVTIALALVFSVLAHFWA